MLSCRRHARQPSSSPAAAAATAATATPDAAEPEAAELERPLVVSIQPTAIVDHLCVIRDEAELKSLVADEIGAAGALPAGCCLAARCLLPIDPCWAINLISLFRHLPAGGSHRVELPEIQNIPTPVRAAAWRIRTWLGGRVEAAAARLLFSRSTALFTLFPFPLSFPSRLESTSARRGAALPTPRAAWPALASARRWAAAGQRRHAGVGQRAALQRPPAADTAAPQRGRAAIQPPTPGLPCPAPFQLLGCRGFDEWGAFWNSAMRRASVGVSGMAVKQGPTARSCILSCGGQRTMRTYLAGCPRLEPEELRPEDFQGAAWAFLSACECWAARRQRLCALLHRVCARAIARAGPRRGPSHASPCRPWPMPSPAPEAAPPPLPPSPPDCLYVPGLLDRAVELARAAGACVALDLASFEVIRTFREVRCSCIFQRVDS